MVSAVSFSRLPDPDLHGEFYADVPLKRLVAWVVDFVAVLILSVLVLPFTAFVGLLIWPILMAAVAMVYRTATLARFSATPGMLLTAIEIRGSDGGRIDPGTAAAHSFLYVAMAAFVVPQLGSIIAMLSNARGRGLHDLLLGTAAINRAAAV